MPTRILSFFRNLLRRPKVEQALDDELRSSVELLTEDNIKQGLSRSEARRQALIELGGVEQVKEEVRAVRVGRLLEDLARDIRYALRALAKSPCFAAVAVLSLALGIGANALVFSVVNALVFRPLPVDRPDQLVFVENKTYGPSQSFPNYRDLRDRNRTFTGLVAYRMSPMELETSTGANRIWGYLATGNYFDLMGVKPALGRFFHQGDDLHPGASPYAVLSYDAWQSRFGADPEIAGKTIRINRLAYTVLG
ncbi:MAG: ABC transporter permease, partial [Deltaproteobacteria bacterium]